MYKIYSRRRIKLPQINMNFNSRNTEPQYANKIIKIVIILFVAFSTFNLILQSVTPVFEKICQDEAKSIATIIANEEATNVMRQHSYDELFSIEKDDEGNITMIKSNIFPINEIISDVAVKIQNKINEKGKDDISIALGSFSGVKLLSGRGPDVKIRISSVGNVETDLRSEFSAQGINQTLHRIYLQVECEISILTPFENITQEIVNQVLIAENVIVGKIPATYYNLEGVSESDVMEVME